MRLLLVISGWCLLLIVTGCTSLSIRDRLAKENAYFDAKEAKPLVLPNTANAADFARDDYYAVPPGLTKWQAKHAAPLVPPTMDAPNK